MSIFSSYLTENTVCISYKDQTSYGGFLEITVICYEIHAELINVLYGLNIEFLYVKSGWYI